MGYDVLFSPMNIGTMTVKNRTVMTAAEVSLGQTDGTPTERLMDYYEERAKGGALPASMTWRAPAPLPSFP